jgi:hypothetical protein
MNVDVTVRGIPQALRELKKLSPELRREIPDRFKTAAAPVLSEARRLVPDRPLSGWGPGGRLGWKPSTVRRSISLRFRATRGRRRTVGDFTVLALSSGKSPALQVYDIAGRKGRTRTEQGDAMVAALNRRARASRVMWEAVERKEPYIRNEIAAVTRDIELLTSRRIDRIR